MRHTLFSKTIFTLALLVGISLSASQKIFGQQVIFAIDTSNQTLAIQ